MNRRAFLAALAAVTARPAAALDTVDLQPFDAGTVRSLARDLAAQRYAPPPMVPQAWQDLTYDEYRLLVFDTRKAHWADAPETPVQIDLFAPGLYFPHPVDVHVVEHGLAREIPFDLSAFHNLDALPDLPRDGVGGYSGLRLRAELETPGIYTEFAVFQGASYFRAIGTGLTYGLSARGLAIDTAAPSGEEFPEFRSFWIERPAPGATRFVVHALMDSPRCTGAYRFEITPGPTLQIEVAAEIFAREDLNNYGLAPLTSMFLYDQTNRHRFDDWRPAIHDSDGLLITNGAGETLWRPLANPKSLQISAFLDRGPRGFGLMQRARAFDDFSDLEARYHNRPGLWITPRGDWGAGSVSLIEIPTDREIYDNIVAYWRPAEPLRAGTSRAFAYGMTWGAGSDYGQGMPVINTAIGAGFSSGLVATIDFGPAGAEIPDDLDSLTQLVRASAGQVSGSIVQRNPYTGGLRLSFGFEPGDAPLIEFRAQLWRDGAPLTEVWLYRWTAS